jgi:hypothetical protein
LLWELPKGNSPTDRPKATRVHEKSSGISGSLCFANCAAEREPGPGSVPGGIRPLRPPIPPTRGRGQEPRCTRGAPERKTGSILAPPFRRMARGKRGPSERRRRTWTHNLGRGIGR